jgi:hypothetical protein
MNVTCCGWLNFGEGECIRTGRVAAVNCLNDSRGRIATAVRCCSAMIGGVGSLLLSHASKAGEGVQLQCSLCLCGVQDKILLIMFEEWT